MNEDKTPTENLTAYPRRKKITGKGYHTNAIFLLIIAFREDVEN